MRRVAWVVVALLALVSPSSAGVDTYVLGDSIGDGLATTMGFHNLAVIGIHIRGPKALEQIARTPPGSTAYIFLGTNDAEGSLKNIDASIDDVLNAAARRKLTLIWVGLHCVRKDWDIQASMLDDILKKHLAKANVTYISTRTDATICSGKFQEPDGIHFTAKGYRYIWAMIESTLDARATAVASAVPPLRADTDITASIAAKPDQARLPDVAPHRIVMDIHVPGSPSDPLIWIRSQN